MIAITSQRTMSGGTETPTVFVMTVAKRVSHSGAVPVIPPRAMTSIAPRSTKPIPRVTTIDWTRKWWTMSPLSPPMTIDAATMTAERRDEPPAVLPHEDRGRDVPEADEPGDREVEVAQEDEHRLPQRGDPQERRTAAAST